MAENMVKGFFNSFFYKYKLKTKLIITYFLVVIIPVVVMGYFLTESQFNMTVNDKVKTASVSLMQTKENMKLKLERQKSVIDTLLTDRNFMNYLNTYYDDNFNSLTDYMEKIAPIFDRFNFGGKEFFIKVFSKNTTIGFSGITNNYLDELKNEKWYEIPGLSNKAYNWTGLYKKYESDSSYFLGCYRTLYDLNNNEVIAVFTVFLNEYELYNLISEQGLGGNVVYLFDSRGRIITTTERSRLFAKESDITFKGADIQNLKNGSIVDYMGKNYIYNSAFLDYQAGSVENWKLVYLAPADQLLKDINKVWVTSALLAFVSITLSLVIILIVTKNFNSRISNLLTYMKKVFDGDMKARVNVRGTDEIAELQSDFNSMVSKLDSLIYEVYETKINLQENELRRQKIETRQKSSELKALQRQINPHYLINTLETVRMNLVLKNDRINANIIKILADTFRVLVYDNRKKHSMKEELDFIDNYMIIQNYKYANITSIIRKVPDELLGIELPKLIIQPLVENSIHHGLKEKEGEGFIEIKAYKDMDTIFISVSDNGSGIKEEDLFKIKKSLECIQAEEDIYTSNFGIALNNINSRIKLEYGEEFGLDVKSKEGEGTSVVIGFPYNIQA